MIIRLTARHLVNVDSVGLVELSNVESQPKLKIFNRNGQQLYVLVGAEATQADQALQKFVERGPEHKWRPPV